ncbi:MAG: hypothetical protein U0X75_02620 [Acidobacteriota bacterium]
MFATLLAGAEICKSLYGNRLRRSISSRNKSNYFLIRSTVLGGKVLAEFKDLSTMAENDPAEV